MFERDDVLVSVGVLADQADIVAQSVHGHVACHGKGFEEVDLFVADGKRARTVHFADDGNFIIGHANRHNGVFVDVSFQLFLDQIFRFAFGQSADMEGAQHGEVDVAPVVDQILLKGRLAGQAFLCIADRGGYGQVERFCQFRIVLHDTTIVSRSFGRMRASYKACFGPSANARCASPGSCR